MITFPNAKINLGLNIVEKRPDGYHNLETVFYPIPLFDALEVIQTDSAEKDCTLNAYGNSIEGNPDSNLVVKAYRLLKTDYPDLPPVTISLLKKIPMGAGLGGGSSDASFMIKLLNDTFGLNLSIEKMENYAASLGADCALFIKNKAVYATGIGNILHPIELSLKGYHLIVIKPDVFVSTAMAYSMIKPQNPKIHLPEIINQPVKTWKEHLANDFEESVFNQFPEIQSIKNELYAQGAIYASMSGSGSSVYGLFSKEAMIGQLQDMAKSFNKYFFRVLTLE